MPLLLVLSAPSGGGKSSLARRLLEGRTDTGYSVSATTRPRRPGEVEGTSYHFLTRAEFERREAAGEFLESASYNGERYGTLRREVERLHAAGRHAVLDIEVEGARQVRRRSPDAVLVFVLPPSGTELVRRLRDRGTEDRAALRRRLAIANDELGAVAEYDYVVINDELDRAAAEVSAILSAEGRRRVRLTELPAVVATIQQQIAHAAMGLSDG
jgi:guanylate kinase